MFPFWRKVIYAPTEPTASQTGVTYNCRSRIDMMGACKITNKLWLFQLTGGGGGGGGGGGVYLPEDILKGIEPIRKYFQITPLGKLNICSSDSRFTWKYFQMALESFYGEVYSKGYTGKWRKKTLVFSPKRPDAFGYGQPVIPLLCLHGIICSNWMRTASWMGNFFSLWG